MDSIVVGFSKAKHWYKLGSKLICLVDNAPFSHTYIRFYAQKYDTWLIYEAKGAGVNFCSIDNFNDHATVVEEYLINITEEAKNKTVGYAIKNCGNPYGVIQLVGMAWVMLLKRLGCKSPKNPFTKGTVCSELVGHILRDCLGEDVPQDLDIASPKDINILVKKIHKDQQNG